MDDNDWKLFMKEALSRFCKSKINYPTIKMSEIETISILSYSFDTSSLQTQPEHENNTETLEKSDPKTTVCNIVNDLKSSCDYNGEPPQKMNNSITLKTKNTDETNLPKLKIIPFQQTEQSPPPFVNDLSKTKSPIVDKNSSDLVFTHRKEMNRDPTTNNKQKQPIMGKTALLKKANIDPDSLIIQGIILNKYENVLNHYVGRMYKRRLSRLSSSEMSEDELDDSLSSSFPVYSPSSMSPIETPGSLACDTKNRFEFPVCESKLSYYATNYYLPPSNLSFLMSTDDCNVETTAEDLNESSMVSSDTGNAESMTSVSEYDPKKFLENALGDLTNFSESGICNNNSSRLSDHHYDRSMGSSNISSLLSKASSFYSSVKKNIKRRRHSLKSVCLLEESQNGQHSAATNQLLENLKRELAIQNAIMFQISKALNYCRASKEFVSGKEHIEAEKILLVATITKEALVNEINTIEFNTYQNNSDPRCLGELHIRDVAFHMNEKTTQADSREYFLVVAACGKKIVSSEVIEATDGSILVVKLFKFSNLLADFEISLSIYSMSVRNKVHIIQDNVKCPSPKSIFRCTKESRKYRGSNNTLYIEPLAFALMGKCFLRVSDLSKAQNNSSLSLKLQSIPTYSSVCETVTVKFEHNFRLSNKTGGFLTVGTENEQLCTTWNRRWCLLEGHLFKYWNYPSEEVTTPLGSIDLSYCVAQNVVQADRKICARSKTLMIPIRSGNNVKKYLLSADTASDMEMWEKELNFVIRSLMIWNSMKCSLVSP